ncbi:MAG: phospho-sugar mutase, partial [Deltaproteobacteria bacterium]|nr:phospho-sugar mutase [Deltaproteobacteria bacterium]
RGSDTLPPADLVVFDLADGARVMVRPSGTEPKLKVYVDVPETVADGETLADAEARGAARAARILEAVPI